MMLRRLLFVFAGALALQFPGDDSLPTFPEFQCPDGAVFCNDAAGAGLDAGLHYGRGAAWADIDGDGWDDLFLADCDNRWDPDGYGVSMFFLNRRDGTFDPVPATALGVADEDLVSTWNGSFADYDNDGDPDLLLANGGYSGVSNLALYENRINEGRGFIPVTVESGIGVADAAPSHWWGSAWADYDLDGWLDVVVTRTEGRALLFRNNGDTTFTETGGTLAVGVDMEDGKNPVWTDYDRDGDPDLYLAGIWQHVFYRNDGESFVDITPQIFRDYFPLPARWAGPPPPIVFAALAEDFNQDGFDDLYLGRFDVADILLLNDGAGAFESHAADWGIDTAGTPGSDLSRPFENTMGLGVGDLFDDGMPDVFIGTGNPGRAAPDVVFCNTDDDAFYRCTHDVLGAGLDRAWRTRGHGTVFSDYDHDGDTDMAVNLGGHPGFDAEQARRRSPESPALFVNRAGAGGRTAALTLVGSSGNRDAVGARIRVDGARVRYYTIRSMQGFQSQNSRTLSVFLGNETEAGAEITWPSGAVQTITIVAGERRTVVEP